MVNIVLRNLFFHPWCKSLCTALHLMNLRLALLALLRVCVCACVSGRMCVAPVCMCVCVFSLSGVPVGRGWKECDELGGGSRAVGSDTGK